MRTTIDKAGRIVVPKAMRDELALTAGTTVEITVVEGRLEIEPPRPTVTIGSAAGRPVIDAPAAAGLSTEDVRRTRLHDLDPRRRADG